MLSSWSGLIFGWAELAPDKHKIVSTVEFWENKQYKNGIVSNGFSGKKNLPTRWFVYKFLIFGAKPIFPIVAPVIAITKSPSLSKKDLAFLVCSSETKSKSVITISPLSISLILTTGQPSSCHHSLLNAKPDFILT